MRAIAAAALALTLAVAADRLPSFVAGIPGMAGSTDSAGAHLSSSLGVADAQTVPRIGAGFGEIGRSGGTVRTGAVSVAIPARAVPAGAALSVAIIPQLASALPPSPANLVLSGSPFSLLILDASGRPVEVEAPLELRIPFPHAPSRPALPQIYALIDQQWRAIPTEVEGQDVVGSWTIGAAGALFLRPIPSELPRTGATTAPTIARRISPLPPRRANGAG